MLMKIDKILVQLEVQEKILWKHGITREELENALLEGKPKFFKIRANVYMAVAHYSHYITVVFEYDKNNAVVKTAYKSADWQIRKYSKK